MPDTAAGARWAVYFAPPKNAPLWRLGSRWLGRDAATGETWPPPDAVPREQWASLVRKPAHYGFHATLKPPMPLDREANPEALRSAVTDLATARTACRLGALRIRRIGRFFALVPVEETPELNALAADCVRLLDGLRAPDTLGRAPFGLTARQCALAERWGYPFVFDQFRFHMTLTDAVADADAPRVAEMLAAHFPARVLTEPMHVDALALYYQPERMTAFRMVERIPLGTPKR